MVKMDQLAESVYKMGVATLRAGVTTEFPGVEQLSNGYWAMVSFLELRGAMLVGNMADPKKVLSHLKAEQDEAKADINDRKKLILELGDSGFIALVIGGLLWTHLSKSQMAKTREVLFWTQETAHDHNIDLNNAIVSVAIEKNPRHYPVKDLQILTGEKVHQVVRRLPKIYKRLRERRVKEMIDDEPIFGYSHVTALENARVTTGRRLDS